MGSNQAPTDPSTVLVVDPADTVADRLYEKFERQPSIQFRTEPDLDRVRTSLASAGIDCLVLNLDPLDEADRQAFVTDTRTIAPHCPIILFTTYGPEAFTDDLLTQMTTVVELSDDPDNWGFLIEKIQSMLRTAPGDEHDMEMYQMLVETARDGLYRLDANGDMVYANESWAEMLGYERSELLGVHITHVMADGELERGQRLSQQVLEDDNRESDIIDLEIVTKDGDQITVAIHFVVLTTEEGAYDGVVGVARDVTEQRATKRELKRKNKRLDEFVSTVSHDLRNPLQVAQGRMNLAREECNHEHLEAIDRALTRMDTLVEELLTLAREGEQVSDVKSLELAAVVEDCWRNVETTDATLRTRIDRSIQADRSRLQQLFENLIRNAVEHGGNAVTVTVGELDDGFYVKDDGSGLPDDDRDAVFDAGFTTTADGTGFGLSIVKQVVEAHDWEIRVTKGSEGGTRFEITGVTFASE